MIPKYFRCGDPSQKCPLSVTKEIIKDDPSWACPCAHPNCSDFREPVGLVNGITGGRAKLTGTAAAALALLILGVLLFTGGNPALERLRELQARFAPLKSAVTGWRTQSAAPTEEKRASQRVSDVERKAEAVKKRADEAMASGSPSAIAQAIHNADEQLSLAKHLAETFDQAVSGKGANIVEARMLLVKLQQLQDDTETAIEATYAESADKVSLFEEFLKEVKGTMAKARQMANPPQADSGAAETETQKKQIQSAINHLSAIKARLATYSPPSVGPWPRSEAGFRMASTRELTRDLIGPLAGAWAGVRPVEGPEGQTFLTSPVQGKILLEACSVEEGFAKLAGGEITVFFADRTPTESELKQFGPAFKSSRSVAEVIALDALTLLVNPEVTVDTFEIGKPFPLRLAAGPVASSLRQRAEMFGIASPVSLDAGGEQAALIDSGLLALDLYHNVGTNLRAKRLAVKASAESVAVKPSPFSIATEDYPFSYRIVAWTANNPKPEAIGLVKFITSNEGQTIVAEKGFVDLRLRPMLGDIPPEIQAALGVALGVDKVTSALRLSTNFRFEVGEARLDLKAQADLERLPRFIAESYPAHKLVILGFTDTDGGPGTNMPLSKNRAEVVAADLRRSKIDTRSGGLGPAFPVDSNATEAGKAKNRRAEVWVVMP